MHICVNLFVIFCRHDNEGPKLRIEVEVEDHLSCGCLPPGGQHHHRKVAKRSLSSMSISSSAIFQQQLDPHPTSSNNSHSLDSKRPPGGSNSTPALDGDQDHVTVFYETCLLCKEQQDTCEAS